MAIGGTNGTVSGLSRSVSLDSYTVGTPAVVGTNTIAYIIAASGDNRGGVPGPGGATAAGTMGPMHPPATVPTRSSAWTTINIIPVARPTDVRARSTVGT